MEGYFLFSVFDISESTQLDTVYWVKYSPVAGSQLSSEIFKGEIFSHYIYNIVMFEKWPKVFDWIFG